MKQLDIKVLIAYIVGILSFAGIIFAAIFITNDGFSLKPENNKTIVDRTNVIVNMNQKKIQNYGAVKSKTDNSMITPGSSNGRKISSGEEIHNASKNRDNASTSAKSNESNGFAGLKNIGSSNYTNNKVSGQGSKLYASSAPISNSGGGIANGSKLGSGSKTEVINPASMKIGQKSKAGGPPPSEHEGGSPSLPIGDGWILMLLFASGYTAIKLNSKSLGI